MLPIVRVRALFPQRTNSVLNRPNTKDDVVFDYSDAARWNPPLIPGTFDQPVPGGMPKQFVDCK
jgi:hypothetical protein